MLLIEAPVKLSTAWGLVLALPPAARQAPVRRVLDLVLQADAVNYLLPSASIGGNALLVRGLAPGVPVAMGVVAVTTAQSAQAMAQFLFALTGSALALAAVPVPATTRPWVAAVMGVSALVIAFFFLVQTGGLFAFLNGLLRRARVRIPYLIERESKIAAMDEGLRAALRDRPGDFALSMGSFLFGWAAGALELAVVLLVLGIAFDWRQAVAVEAIAVFVDGLAFFVPAKAGSQEGGKVLAFAAVGLPPAAGLAFGLLRRARELAWTALGYALLARRRRT